MYSIASGHPPTGLSTAERCEITSARSSAFGGVWISAIRNVLQDPAVRKLLAEQGSAPVGNSPEDVFDGKERVIAVVIQRPYMRQVYVP
jgi:hypothetical protein